MLKPLITLINALSSNTHPGAIAHAFACGMLLGFMPKENLLWIILFVFILFMRIQRATYTLSLIVGALLAALLDPFFHTVDCWILSLDSMEDFYAYLLDIPFVAFTKFNNSVVMGSLVCGIIAYIPFYLFGRLFVWLWRKYLAEGVRRLKVVRVIKQIPLIQKLSSLTGDK